jgi:hypothetical protein
MPLSAIMEPATNNDAPIAATNLLSPRRRLVILEN